MHEPILINRESEKTLVTGLIKNRSSGVILIVYAPSGFGKSIFTDNIGAELSEQYITIRVESSAVKNEEKPEGFLVREISNSLNNKSLSCNHLLSYETYKTKLVGKRTRSNYNSALLKSLRILRPISEIYQRITKTGNFDSSNLISSTVNSEIIELRDYIDFNFKVLENDNTSALIIIENIHVCDETSLKFLADIAYDYEKINFIFEYTVRDKSDEAFHLDDIRKIFRACKNRLKETPLRKLDKSCIANLLELWNVNKEVFRPLLEAYEFTDGNIKKLEDFKMLLNSDLKLSFDYENNELKKIYDNSYVEIFNSLPNDSQFILLTLSSTNVSLHKTLIQELGLIACSEGMFIDSDFAINTLIKRGGLVKINSTETISLAHDSLANSFKKIPNYQTRSLVISNMIANLFEQKLAEREFSLISKFDCLTILVYQYAYIKSAKLLSLLKHYKLDHFLEKSPSTGRIFLAKAKDLIIDQGLLLKGSKLYELLNVYYELDMFSLGYEICLKYHENNIKSLIFESAFLNRLNKHSECISLCRMTLSNDSIAKNLDQILKLKILQIVSFRSLNNLEEMRNVFTEVNSKINLYRDTNAYAQFLRNSEIVLPIQESIRNLEQALSYYVETGNYIDAGKVNLSLSMQYGRLGKLASAEENINLARKRLVNRNVDYCMVLNNEAVIESYKKEYENAERILVIARNHAYSDFDKVVITYNLINVYAELNQKDKIAHYIPYIMSLISNFPHERNHSLDQSVYFNLSVIYSEILNDYDKASNCTQKALELSLPKNSYWKARFNISGNKCSDYRLSHRLHYGFLSHWAINLS